MDAYVEHCIALIGEHGWMVQGVFPAEFDDDVPFCYTVGLTAAGLPELVVSALPAAAATEFLNAAARRSLVTEITAGQLLEGIGPVPFRVVDAPAAEVGMARVVYPHADVRCLQLVWPDSAGAFPGDPGWSLGDAQPVYTGAAGSPS